MWLFVWLVSVSAAVVLVRMMIKWTFRLSRVLRLVVVSLGAVVILIVLKLRSRKWLAALPLLTVSCVFVKVRLVGGRLSCETGGRFV